MSENNVSVKLKRIIQTGLLLALAVVVRNISYMVYFMGAPGMRISLAGIFSDLPAILFGPLYGGIAGGLLDILGFLLKPEGGFLPLLTLTAILDGVLIGFMWRGLEKADNKHILKGFWVFFILVGALGLFNQISSIYFPNLSTTKALDGIGENKGYLALGLVVISVLGILLLLLNRVIRMKMPDAGIHRYYLKLLLSVGLPGILVTTLNTFILQLFIPGLGEMGFVVFWIPRMVKELFMIVLQAYVMSILLTVYDRYQFSRSNRKKVKSGTQEKVADETPEAAPEKDSETNLEIDTQKDPEKNPE